MKNQNESEKLLKSLKFCVFDLETTGGNQKTDKIIEIGIVTIDNMEIVERKNFLIDPERKIPEFIQKLTSIKQKDVKGCPTIEDVLEEVLELFSDRILVAHNSSFDVPFFNSVLKRLGREDLTNKSICTNLMTKYLIPTLMSSNLAYMSGLFGINHTKAHRALDDADATAQLFIKYLDVFKSKGIKKLNHLYYPKNKYELDLYNFKNDKIDKRSDVTQRVTELIDNLEIPHIVTIKGSKGVILYALPCHGKYKEEKEHLKEKIKSIDWETITVKIKAPFIESLISFNQLFNKIEGPLRKEAIDLLWRIHIPQGAKKDLLKEANGKLRTDFIVMNNLVPEQYTIYPLISLGHRNELVFRYPAHKKKLLQFIRSKCSKIESSKQRKIHYPAALKDFLDCYIMHTINETKEFFIFDRSLPQNKEEKFSISLENFIKNNSNTYNYPQDYI